MSQFLWGAPPPFTDLDESGFAANKPLADGDLIHLNQNAKFGAVRAEYLYQGFYKHGNVLPLPVSPVDGYAYTLAETLYVPRLYMTRAPGADFIPGMLHPPGISFSQPGNLFYWITDVTAAGAVQSEVSYLKQGEGSDTHTNDGCVKVYSWCQRAMPVIAETEPFVAVPYDFMANAQPLRTTPLVHVSQNAKFGAVRAEIFDAGYWGNDLTIAHPVSPVDGYTYSQEEVQYCWWIYTNLGPSGSFVNGQKTRPTLANGQLSKRDPGLVGPLYTWIADLEDTTGRVYLRFSYYIQDGEEQIFPDGVLRVYTVGQRKSSNAWVGAGGAGGAATAVVSGVAGIQQPPPPVPLAAGKPVVKTSVGRE
jgi:hypothetical protein